MKFQLSFTLIETLVTILVFTLAMGAVSAFIVMAYQVHGYTWEQSMAIEEARRGVETLIRELRAARSGDDGSFAIEKAEDKEIIFYSDIDKDGQTERVRYFLGTASSGSLVQECVTFSKGGTCSVIFSDFFSGTLQSAQVKVLIEGDLGLSFEYAEIFADGLKLGNLCQTGCSDCAGSWQGTTIFDVTNQASDNSIQFIADARLSVDPICSWQEPNHALKAKFELTFAEELAGASHELKKGVIKPTGSPVMYPLDQEQISTLSSYVRNAPPIFEYYDGNGNRIIDYPARLVDTRLMKIYLIVDVNPERLPPPYELESWVQIRNLKIE